ALRAGDHQGIPRVAVELQLRDRDQPIGRIGMADGKDEVAFARSMSGPGEVMRRTQRRAPVIDAHQCEVQIESRINEVIRIASEESDAGFGREYEPNVAPY